MLSLSSLLNYLPSKHVRNLEFICNTILETGKADIIILFGYYSFSDLKIPPNSPYEILVITDHFETREELSAYLSNQFKDMVPPVNGVIETITLININLEQGLFYFSDILREGIILYNNEEFELAKPPPLPASKRRRIAEKDFDEWIQKAKEEWHLYVEEEREGNSQACVFHLNQVVEFCYRCIEMVFSHNYYEEHNIKAQRDRIRAFDKRIHEAFPVQTKSQIEAFEYLHQAYVGAQYLSEDDFSTDRKKKDYLANETQKLLGLTGKICKSKIQRLKDVEKRYKNSGK